MEAKPSNIIDVDFFTRQIIYPKGFAFFWVYKAMCPACNKVRLKKAKRRDKFYTCPECAKIYQIEEYNAMLKYNLEYTCPECNKSGELCGDWVKPKKKTAKVILKFVCEHCKTKLKVIRMKKQKPKKKKE